MLFARAPSRFKDRHDYSFLTPEHIYQVQEEGDTYFSILDDSGIENLIPWDSPWKILETGSEKDIEDLQDSSVEKVFCTVADFGEGPEVAFFDSELAIQILGDMVLPWEHHGTVLTGLPKGAIPDLITPLIAKGIKDERQE